MKCTPFIIIVQMGIAHHVQLYNWVMHKKVWKYPSDFAQIYDSPRNQHLSLYKDPHPSHSFVFFPTISFCFRKNGNPFVFLRESRLLSPFGNSIFLGDFNKSFPNKSLFLCNSSPLIYI